MSRTIADYKSLVTSQYQNSPKFLLWLQHLLRFLDNVSDCARTFVIEFALDEMWYFFDFTDEVGNVITDEEGNIIQFAIFAGAEGDQLDILGELLGVSRYLDFDLTEGGSALDDDNYRVLLKAKVIKNHWDGKIGSLYLSWRTIFPTGKIVVQDNQDMTMTVILVGSFSQTIVDLITNGLVVPKPEGVGINYIYGTTPFFGFGQNDAYVAGFGTGHWA